MKSIVIRLLPSECPNCGRNTLSLYDRYDKKEKHFLMYIG